MDACRVSIRMGAENVYCVYRRTKRRAGAGRGSQTMPKKEGVKFNWLTAPVRILGDERGWVRAMECIRMELGEPGCVGPCAPGAREGLGVLFEVDTVV